MTARYTLLEISEKLSVDKESVRGLVKFLIAVELAVPRGERKPERGAPELRRGGAYPDEGRSP